jgi:hypothetical protein
MLPLFIGTSAFTTAGWEGTFYPECTKPADLVHSRNIHAVGHHFCAHTVMAGGESVVYLSPLDAQQNLSISPTPSKPDLGKKVASRPSSL